ncbi:MAG TPA: hypothetical protein VHL78_08375 [Actinomycetota bacterium]|nr:hypothetical protein [Actinomycetota bacterium]
MSLLFILTLVAVGVLVAALAVYLLAIIGILRGVQKTAGLILFGVRSIAHRAAPLGEILDEVNQDLTEVRDGLRSVVGPPPAEERRETAAGRPGQAVPRPGAGRGSRRA